MEMRGDTDVYGGIHLYLFISFYRKSACFPGGPVGGKESEDEDSAAYCDYIRWKRTLGEGEGHAEKLRSHNGREECGDGVSGGARSGD